MTGGTPTQPLALELDLSNAAASVPEWLAGVLILIPLLLAVVPLVLGLRYEDVGWHVSLVALSVTALLSVALAARVYVVGAFRYEVAGIPAPYGIELYADTFAITIVVLDMILALGVLAFTYKRGPRGNTFYSAYLLLSGSIIGIALTGDLFNLYVFLEIMGISSYALVAVGSARWSTYAAMKYLLMGTVGATLYLFGVGVTFAATGTLTMRDVATQLTEVGYTDPLVTAGFVLIVVGLLVKIALFPLHTWLADAHASAPDAVSAVISGLIPAVALYALARVVFDAFTLEFAMANPLLWNSIIILAIASLLVGNVFALLQQNVKLMLAYSTVSQFGLITLGFTIANETALFGSILQMFGHGIIKGALFILAGAIAVKYGAKSLNEYAGLAKRSPLLGVLFILLALGMIGLPPTVGFIGKWYIALGAIEEGMWGVAGVVLVSTLLTVMYVLPFVDRLYFYEPPEGVPVRDEPSWPLLFVLVLGALFGIGLGLVSAWLETALSEAITDLLTT